MGISDVRQLAGLRAALSVCSFALLTFGPATFSPAIAQNACSVSLDGTTVTCTGVPSGGVVNSSGPSTVNVDKGTSETSLNSIIGIDVHRYGVSGASAADANTPIRYETTEHDIAGVPKTVVANDANPPVPILMNGFYIVFLNPTETDVALQKFQLVNDTASGQLFDGGAALANYLAPSAEGGGVVTGSLTVRNSDHYRVANANALQVQSIGGGGGNGGCSFYLFYTDCRAGQRGGNAGTVAATNDGQIITTGTNATAVFAMSQGGGGGNGGGSFALFYSDPGSGGDGGDGGAATVQLNSSSVIETNGDFSHGVHVLSTGGNGGHGGSADAAVTTGRDGGNGGNAGTVTVINRGSIKTSGVRSHGIFAESIGAGAGSGSSSSGIYAVGGNGGGESSGGAVRISNSGQVVTTGSGSYGISGLSVGGGGGDGGGAGGIFSVGGRAGSGGGGGLVEIAHSGSVTTAGENAVGVMGQSIGGGGGNGGAATSGGAFGSIAVGGKGGPGGAGGAVHVNAMQIGQTIDQVGQSSIGTQGDRAHGVMAQSVGGGGGNGGLAASVSAGPFSAGFAFGGSGGSGGAAGPVGLNQHGVVTTSGANANAIFAQSVGGGGGSGGGSVTVTAGSTLALSVALGGTGGGGGGAGAVDVSALGSFTTTGAMSNAVLAQSIGGGGGSGGFAIAGADSALSGSFALGATGGSGGSGGALSVHTGTASTGGTINTSGAMAAGILAQSVGGGGGNGGFAGSVSIGSAGVSVGLGGTGGVGGVGSTVMVANASQITTSGSMSHAMLAQSIGGGGGSGGFAGTLSVGGGAVSVSLGGHGGSGAHSDTTTVTNSGALSTHGQGSYGILAQSIGGGGGNGGASFSGAGGVVGVAVALGGNGGSGGASRAVNVTNSGLVLTRGDLGMGLVAQSIGGGGGNGGTALAATVTVSVESVPAIGASVALGGHGGTGNVAGNVTVTNSGSIITGTQSGTTRTGAGSHAILAQSVGGGGGSGGFAGAASLQLGQGVSFAVALGGNGGSGGEAGTVSVNNTALALLTHGNGANGIYAQSVGGGGGDGGTGLALTVNASESNGLAGSFAIGGQGASGGVGKAVTVTSSSAIETFGADSKGILAQSIGGGGGNGGMALSGSLVIGDRAYHAAVAVGGAGGTGNSAGTVGITNSGVIYTSGSKSTAIHAQSIGGGGGNGGLSASGNFSVTSESSGQIGISIGGNGGSGGSSDAVTVTNVAGASLTTAGTSAHGIQAQSIGGGGGNGGLALQGDLNLGGTNKAINLAVAVGGKGGVGGGVGGAVTASNAGSIRVLGDNANGIMAQSVGGGGGDGGDTSIFMRTATTQDTKAYSLSVAVGGHGGSGNIAGAVSVTNSGSIVTGSRIELADLLTITGNQGYGIFTQSVGGGGGRGGASQVKNEFKKCSAESLCADQSGSGDDGKKEAQTKALSIEVGGNGGTGGDAGSVSVANSGLILTQGHLADGVFAQSVGGGGGVGSGTSHSGDATLDIAVGGKGGAGGDGAGVTVTNSGWVATLGDGSNALFAQSVGGGGGVGGAAKVNGKGAVSVGGSGNSGGAGGAVSVTNSGVLTTTGENANTIFAQSVGGGGGVAGGSAVDSTGYSGLSVGGSGGASGNGGVVTVRNTALAATTGNASSGIFAQSVGGGGGSGGGAQLAANGAIGISIGGKGGAGGSGGLVDVGNSGSISTIGIASHVIFAQSVGGGGGKGGDASVANKGTIALAIGGFGGTATLGGEVRIVNDGTLYAGGALSYGILAQSVGGGGGVGGNASGDGKGKYTIDIGGFGGTGGHGGLVTVTNNGGITTTGDIADALFAQSVGGGGGIGGAAKQTGDETLAFTLGGSGGAGGDGGAATVTNVGQVATLGTHSRGLVAQSIGGGGGTGGAANGSGKGTITIGGQGSAAGNAGAATVTNSGLVATLDEESSGIFVQSVGGGGGTGGASFVKVTGTAGLAIGGSGGASGQGGAAKVSNSGLIETVGTASYGIFAQSVGGGGGTGGAASVESGGTFALALGGNGGVASHGGATTVSNTGSIQTWGGFAHALFAQSVGGGGGVGGNTSVKANGTFAADIGGAGNTSGNGGAVTLTNDGRIVTAGLMANGIFAQSVGGGGGMGGNASTETKGKMTVAVGGSGGASGNGGAVSVDNRGSISTLAIMSHGIFAQSVGGGGGVGGNADIGAWGPVGVGGKGGAAGDGGNVRVASTTGGVIETFGAGSMGVFAQSVGGGGGLAGSVHRAMINIVDTPLGPIKANVGIGLALGQGGGNGGNGGSVDVDFAGTIITHGDGATGLLAQSVGGGGGLVGDLGNGGIPILSALSWHLGSNGDAGNAGVVDIAITGNVFTSGNSATGVLAQSSGGAGSGSDVSVAVNGNIFAATLLAIEDGNASNPLRGLGSVGIMAHSAGWSGNGDISIDIADVDGVVRGGRSKVVDDGNGGYAEYAGVGVWVIDGKDNTVTNRGTITTADGTRGGYALYASGSDPDNIDIHRAQKGGNERIDNYGVITGSVDLGAGTNAFFNHAGSWLDTGSILNVGAGNVVENSGLLSVGGHGFALTTALTGDYRQTVDGTLHAEMDMRRIGNPEASDLLDISGSATINGKVSLGLVNAGSTKAGTFSSTFLRSAGPMAMQDVEFVLPHSAIATYGVAVSANELAMTVSADFILPSLNEDQGAMARYIDTIQAAGGSSELDLVIASLVGIENEEDYARALNQLLPQPYIANQASQQQGSIDFGRKLMSCRVAEGSNRFTAEGECNWANVSVDRNTRDASKAHQGYDFAGTSLAAGRQVALGEHVFGGLGVSYDFTRGVSAGNAQITRHGIAVGGVLKGQHGGTTLATALSGGIGVSDTERQISLSLVDYTLRGRQMLAHVGAGFSASHAFESDLGYIKPQLDMNATGIIDLGYFETGGPVALQANMSGNLFVTITPSIEIGTELTLQDDYLLRPFLRAGAATVVAGARPSGGASFGAVPAGTGEAVVHGDLGGTVLDLSLGADLLNLNGVNVRGLGQGRFGKDTAGYGLQVKVSGGF